MAAGRRGCVVTRGAGGGEVTERDVRLLRYLGRFRGLTSPQLVRRFFDDSESSLVIVNRRMAVMRRLGLVDSQRVFAHHPSVHNLTRAGMHVAQVYGPVRALSVGQLEHDLAVADLTIMLSRATPGLVTVTEREIWAADTGSGSDRDHPRYAVRALPDMASDLVVPDLITVQDGVARAHEVEHTAKHKARWRDLMLSYAISDHIGAVTYYVRPRLTHRITAAAEAAAQQLATGAFGNHALNITVSDWVWQPQEGSA